MPAKKGQKLDRKVISALILAFFLSVCCFLLAFALNDIGAFGNKTVLISDMKKQYIAFYSALREGRFHTYSFEIGLGTPTVALFAYYLSSPFSLLIFLFPAERLPTAIFFIILLKVACSAVTFCYYLIRKEKAEPIQAVPFALCYSLMSFVFFYFINQFWLDALIWLPLLILSLDEILERKTVSKTIVLLAVLFISNYYISYMTGAFTALYLLYTCFCRKIEWKDCLAAVGRLALSAVIAFCCAGFLLIPTFYQMISSLSGSYDGYGIVNYTLKQMVLKLFIGYFDSIGNYAAPTIFCGTLGLLLAVLYFFNGSISKRERVGSAVFLGFLMISTYLPFLDKIWHGFAYPNAFAYRYAFCISFLLVTLAARSYLHIGKVPKEILLAAFAVPAVLLVLITKLLRNVSPYTAAAEILFTAAYPCFLLFRRKGKQERGALTALLLLLVCAEMSLNGALVLKGVDAQNEFPLYSQYTEYHQRMEDILKDTDPFVRKAYVDDERLNAGMEIGFLSPSLFSSAYDPIVADTVSKMGYGKASKQYWYEAGYEETDRLLGIGYRLEAKKEGSGESPVIAEISVEKLDGACPLGFFIPKERIGEMIDSGEDHAQGQIHAFLEAAKPEENPIRDLQMEGATLRGTISAPSVGAVWFSIPAQRGWRAFVDGKEVPVYTSMDYFIAVPVGEGDHAVELRYRTPMQTAGLAISAVGILLTCCLVWTERRKDFSKR